MDNNAWYRGRDGLILTTVVILVVVITTLPYWYAERAGGISHVFGGFLINPVDGNSYLAKMQQGWRGAWQFTLPYTAQQGKGAYIFLLYLTFGHIARWTGLSLLVVYQVARVGASVLMLVAIFRLFHRILPTSQVVRFAFLLAAFGAGMGWLLVPFGAFTADFWVAEAYPFLSAYANPHFPLTIALMALLLTPPIRLRFYGILSIVLALGLAIISPFGSIVCLGILIVLGGLQYIQRREVSWACYRALWLAVGAGPVILYDLMVVRLDPVLSGWNTQNVTPSPPIWDFLISFSPAIVFAFVGLWCLRKNSRRNEVLLSLWVILIITLIYLPLNLQRRLLVSFYLPLAALAALGLEQLISRYKRRFLPPAIMIFMISIPSSILVILAAFQGIRTFDPALYLTKPEADALQWIDRNTPEDALVLSGPEIGLLIPAWTGRRVIYGHPFETVNAEGEEAAVQYFFSGSMSVSEMEVWLVNRQVDYVFFSNRERSQGSPEILDDLSLVYDTGGVKIYQITEGNQ